MMGALCHKRSFDEAIYGGQKFPLEWPSNGDFFGIERGLSEHAVRVPQRPKKLSSAGNREAAMERGAFLLLTFLGQARKVSRPKGEN